MPLNSGSARMIAPELRPDAFGDLGDQRGGLGLVRLPRKLDVGVGIDPAAGETGDVGDVAIRHKNLLVVKN